MHLQGPTSNQVVANTQLPAGGVRELASGVDALYLSGHAYLPKALLARLEDARLFADQVSLPVPFELGQLTFGLAPHGWGKYRFCLDHESGRIGFTSSTRLPAARIQPRAEFLHALGPAGTVRHFDELLRPLMDRLVLNVARLDLFCDVEGLVLRGEDRTRLPLPGRYQHHLRGRSRLHGVLFRLPAYTADQRPHVRQDGRNGVQGN